MPAVVFGRYHLIGNEGADFQVGNRLVLDPYDGFFDQNLDSVKVGDFLFFLLDSCKLEMPRQKAPEQGQCREIREGLDPMPMISGRIVEFANGQHTFEVDTRETFRDVLRRKPAGNVNEAVSEIEEYRTIWTSALRGREQFGQSYRFQLVVRLPRVSDVERALDDEFRCVPQMNFGEAPPRSETFWQRGYPLFIERIAATSSVRVIALGSNDIDSCRIFDLTDLKDYRNSIQTALEQATSIEETNCWRHLLQ
jgi:hypothetical protein